MRDFFREIRHGWASGGCATVESSRAVFLDGGPQVTGGQLIYIAGLVTAVVIIVIGSLILPMSVFTALVLVIFGFAEWFRKQITPEGEEPQTPLTIFQESELWQGVGVAYLMTAINDRNGEVRLGAQLGQNPAVSAEWYQPLDYDSRYFRRRMVTTDAGRRVLIDAAEARSYVDGETVIVRAPPTAAVR